MGPPPALDYEADHHHHHHHHSRQAASVHSATQAHGKTWEGAWWRGASRGGFLPCRPRNPQEKGQPHRGLSDSRVPLPAGRQAGRQAGGGRSHLLVQKGDGGGSHVDLAGRPLFSVAGGQSLLQSGIDDIHSWGTNHSKGGSCALKGRAPLPKVPRALGQCGPHPLGTWWSSAPPHTHPHPPPPGPPLLSPTGLATGTQPK